MRQSEEPARPIYTYGVAFQGSRRARAISKAFRVGQCSIGRIKGLAGSSHAGVSAGAFGLKPKAAA